MDKTHDKTDPRDLPYRFAPSLVTGEVFIISLGHGFNIMGYFENFPSFHRFLLEGIKTDDLLQEGIMREATNILREQEEGEI